MVTCLYHWYYLCEETKRPVQVTDGTHIFVKTSWNTTPQIHLGTLYLADMKLVYLLAAWNAVEKVKHKRIGWQRRASIDQLLQLEIVCGILEAPLGRLLRRVYHLLKWFVSCARFDVSIRCRSSRSVLLCPSSRSVLFHVLVLWWAAVSGV